MSASHEPLRPTTTTTSRPGIVTMVLAAVGLVALMLVGIIVLGRLANSDVVAMLLTGVFFAALLVGIGLMVRGNRRWLLPLGVPFAVVALGAGVLLGLPLVTDDVVDEDIVTVAAPTATATAPSGTSPATSEPTPAAPVNVALASGSFGPIAHPGVGTATLIETPSDGVKLTFTEFETDNGPDVRVYLSRGTNNEGVGESFIDLGAMKGNKGNQQYEVPTDVDVSEFDSVVLWCRAFDVGFIQAPLTTV